PCLFLTAAPTATYTLSLHDALPIWRLRSRGCGPWRRAPQCPPPCCRGRRIGSPAPWSRARRSCCRCRAASRSRSDASAVTRATRSEEHTSELQSPDHLVCRLLLEKK